MVVLISAGGDTNRSSHGKKEEPVGSSALTWPLQTQPTRNLNWSNSLVSCFDCSASSCAA